MRDAWMTRKVKETQGLSDRSEWGNFFAETKAVYDSTAKGTGLLLSADGIPLLTEKTKILKRSAEHFIGMLYRHSTIFDAPPPKNPAAQHRQKDFNSHSPQPPQRPSVRLSGSQCDFRRHRGTTDPIFSARQQQEKCHGIRIHLNPTFVDLTKVFDTVNREGPWKIMQKCSCTERFTRMRRTVKAGAAIYEDNRITAAKAKREVLKSQLPPPRNAKSQPPPTCPRRQRTFRAPVGLIRHLRANCSTQRKPADVSSSPSAPSTSSSSTTTIAETDSDTADLSSPHCPNTFFSPIDLADHLQVLEHQPTLAASASTSPLPPHIPPPYGPIRSHAHPREPEVDNRRLHHTFFHQHLHHTTTSPTTALFKHSVSDSHLTGKCASRLFLHMAPLLHVRSKSESITVRQVPWPGRPPIDAPTKSTQSD
ncbi:hypothetical protein SprV_0200737600 [Sparganum proliferum]